MKTVNTIIKNSFWLIIGELLGKLFVFLLTIFVARNILVEDFGKYNMAMSFSMLFAFITELGLNIYLFREIAKDKARLNDYVNNVISIRVVLIFIYITIVATVITVMNVSRDIKYLVYMFTGWMCFTNLTYIFRTAFKALEDMKWDAVINVIDNGIRLLMVIILLNVGIGILGVGISYLIASLVSFLAGLVIYNKYYSKIKYTFTLPIWTRALKEMWYFALVAMLVPLFGKFETIILSSINGNNAVGYYSAALKIVWMLIFIPGFTTQSAFPKLSQYAINDKAKFRSAISYLIKYNIVITIVISIFVYILSSLIINKIYGPKYDNSIYVLQILIWSLPLHAINGVFIYGLNAMNKQRTNSIFIGSAIFIDILLSIIVAPKYSYIGVAYATTASLLLLSIFNIIYYLINRNVSVNELKVTDRDINILKNIFIHEVSQE